MIKKYTEYLTEFSGSVIITFIVLSLFNAVSSKANINQTTGSFNFHNVQTGIPGGVDFITNSKLYSSNTNIRGIAAAIEQRGTNAGRIWAVVLYSADVNYPDTFNIYYSLNSGQGWNFFGSGNVRPNDKVNYNDIDMELMENNTGQKYLWVAFGYRQGGVNGPLKTGGFILQVPNLNGVFFNEMVWPGADSTKNYYDIHLTSDNARYPATPYVFLSCSFDTLDGNGNRIYGQRLARNIAPYSLATPNFFYTSKPLFWTDSSPANQRKTVYTDIAYFHNGGSDSVLISFSGAKDSSKIYFSKSDRLGNAPLSGSGEVAGLQTNDWKTHARISSNGNDNGNIICAFRQFTGGNWNIKYFSSTSFGNFNAPFSESLLLGSGDNPNYPPDIIGARNGSTHYLSFITTASTDSLRYFSLNSSGIQNSVSKMNYYNSLGKEVGPKALFSYKTGDSCLVFYTESGPVNMLSAAGCGGEPIGILYLNGISPKDFALEQNYPNPFNPVTKIRFSLLYSSKVSMVIYDALGRKVESLIEDNLKPGVFDAVWDGSNYSSGIYFYSLNAEYANGTKFSSVKKMVLLK